MPDIYNNTIFESHNNKTVKYKNMINRYTTKHLLHQSEKMKSSGTNELEKTYEPTILNFPQINRSHNHIEKLVKHPSIKFVVHKPHQSSCNLNTQDKNAKNLPEPNITKSNTGTFAINTGNIRKKIEAVKTKYMNYFNEKAS